MYCSIYPVIGRQTELPFYVSGIGISEPEYHIVRENGLASHQFLFVREGSGTFGIDGKSFPLNTGSILYAAKGVPHEYYPNGEVFTTNWVVFRGEHLSELMKTLGFGEYGIAENSANETVRSLFNILLSAAKEPDCDPEKCSRLLYEYILEMRRIFCTKHGSDPSADSVTEAAVRYINEHFYEDITLGALAALTNISEQHFCRLFKARFGLRPMEYVALKRISHAKSLLETTNESIARIGELSGYHDPNYFGIVFRRYESVSPSVYRNMHGIR